MRKLLCLALLSGCTNFGALGRDYGDLGEDAAVPALDLADRDSSRELPDLENDADIARDCSDQVKDGNESDIDCGGSCAPCDVGRVCVENADCQTGACITAICELASGPPFWTPVGTAPTGNGVPVARLDLQMGLGSDGSLYAIGGRDANGGSLSTVEKLDQTGAWSAQSGNLSERRADFAVASVGGTLFAIDGDTFTGNGGGNFVPSVDRSTTADMFSNVSGLGDNRGACAGTVGADGKIYVYGGNDGTSYLTTGFTFGATDATTTPLGALTTGRQFHGAALGGDNRLYAIGGTNAAGTLASVEAYAVAANTWSAVTALPSARTNVPAATGPDGRIYVAGGWDPEGGVVYATTVAYRAATTAIGDRWVTLASALANPRYRHAVATGADGRIYVVGGVSLQGALRTTEAYGPIVTLSASSGAAGSTLSVSGSNFAASAAVKITIAGPSGTVIGTGVTDTTGALAAVNVMIPAGTATVQTRIFATDARSRYPVSGAFNVTP